VQAPQHQPAAEYQDELAQRNLMQYQHPEYGFLQQLGSLELIPDC
jgi:hypothetical protein